MDSVSMKKIKVQQPGLHKLVRSGELDRLISKVEHDHKCAISGLENYQPHGQFAGASIADSKKCGNVTISWKPGDIVTEHVSIQVGSSTGKLFDIFVKAGGLEFSKHAVPGNNMQVIDETGNLPCDYVILDSCYRWDGGKGEAEKDLRSSVRECLLKALDLNAASIAFPIIGTGGLGFPYDRASQIMISEVINVAGQLVKRDSLKDICFVVFDQDTDLVNVFNQEFTKAFASGSGLSVEVDVGDLTKEEVDAIVNVNATDMNMQKAGALSKAIAAAAGPTVQTECTRLGQQAAGSAVVTGSGMLKAKYIIHMTPGEASVQHIQQCIEKCLETADESKFQSISIPACGTGAFKLSANDSAEATFQAFKVHSYFKHLKKVRIVIFKPYMLPEFSKKMGEYETSVGGFKSIDERITSIELRVYGKSKDVTDIAVADLKRGFDEACKTKTIKDKNISKLSEHRRKWLTEKAYDLGAEIKFDERKQRIVFRGALEDITTMETYVQAVKEIPKDSEDKVIALPKEWCPMPKKKGKEEKVHLVSLSHSSPEYLKVLKMFQETMGTGRRFLMIERIQNPHLYKHYMLHKEQMDKDNGGMQNERLLFHGTAGGNVNGINRKGFNRIFRGSNVGAIYGEGVYFAKNASTSFYYALPDANKTRYMYVARVLVGRYVRGNLQMKVPPNDPRTGTPFDSTADLNYPGASIFVAYYDWQCYPQYLITFQ